MNLRPFGAYSLLLFVAVICFVLAFAAVVVFKTTDPKIFPALMSLGTAFFAGYFFFGPSS